MKKKQIFNRPQWQIMESLLVIQGKTKRDLRNVWGSICYMTKTGCQWRSLPENYPSWQTVHWYFRKWTLDGTIEIAHQESFSQTGREK